jgi:hypothetical protein
MNKTDKFIQKVIKVHGDMYSYNKVEYINAKTKVEIFCNKHQEYFTQTPDKHLQGNGCPKCGREKTISSRKISQKDFIKRSNKKHNNFFNYKETIYTGSSNKVKITCPKHGEFLQLPVDHLQGKGCKKCAVTEVAIKNTLSTEKFIEKAKEIHKDTYEYSKVDYKNAKLPVIITCKIHGDFEQKPYHHTQGSGCKECGKISTESSKHDTKETFIEKVKSIHGDTYDYSLVDYSGSNSIIDIICKKHGIFSQRIGNHLNKQYGCPKCNNQSSKAEKIIVKFLQKYTEVIEGDKKILEGKELDIYLPNYNIAIEFNGLYWHSDKFVDKKYHLIKTEACKRKGIRLIHIFEDEWNYNKELVKSRLLSFINIDTNRIFARKCIVKEITSREASKFLDETHIQGKVGSKVKLGLYYNDELVSLMTFGSHRLNMGGKFEKDKYELLRLSSKKNTLIVGGASKLLKHFIRNYKPKSIISYADRRWSEGNVYEKIGFNKVSTSKPNYFYTKGTVRENRFKYRKSELVKVGFSKEKTEKQIMTEQGYYRIYDCGTIKYEMIIK